MDLVPSDGAHNLEIIHVRDDEAEIVELARAAQVCHAVAGLTSGGGRPAPALDDLCGPLVFGPMAGVHQKLRDPGTAHLILFAELVAAAGADDGDATATVC